MISLPALWLRRYSRLRVSHLMTSVIRLVNRNLDVAICGRDIARTEVFGAG